MKCNRVMLSNNESESAAPAQPKFSSLKKSLPLSSITMKAGKSSTSMRQIASKSRPSGEWSDDDYDVFDGDRHIGRIMWTHAGPADRQRNAHTASNCSLTERHHGRHVELGGTTREHQS